MDWAEKIKLVIDEYNQLIVPYIKKDFYESAVAEINTSLPLLEEGWKEMPTSSVRMYTYGLIAEFRRLQHFCGVDNSSKKEIEKSISLIEQKIQLIELGVNSVLEK